VEHLVAWNNRRTTPGSGDRVEPDEIWQSIVKADEALKYATDDRAGRRRQQAVERLRRALREAEAIGSASLAEQARRRLEDLGEADA
jgi:pilus assembly protein TadC